MCGLPSVLRPAALTGALLLLLLQAPPSGNSHAQVRISQIFGGGGNSGSQHMHDFIELFNAGSEPVSLAGWSVQYASASGSTWQRTELAGWIGPRAWYLVQEAAGSGSGSPLPAPDATGTIGISATAGKVALVTIAAALAGGCPGEGPVADLVGFGAGTGCFLGSGPAPAPGNTRAIIRKGGGVIDARDNALDFELRPPAPRNSSAPPLVSSAGVAAAATAGLGLWSVAHPWGPSTSIVFTVPRQGRVSLRVYDVLGREAARLFEGDAEKGRRYEQQFPGAGLAAGLYFVRLAAEGKALTVRVLLLR